MFKCLSFSKYDECFQSTYLPSDPRRPDCAEWKRVTSPRNHHRYGPPPLKKKKIRDVPGSQPDVRASRTDHRSTHRSAIASTIIATNVVLAAAPALIGISVSRIFSLVFISFMSGADG